MDIGDKRQALYIVRRIGTSASFIPSSFLGQIASCLYKERGEASALGAEGPRIWMLDAFALWPPALGYRLYALSINLHCSGLHMHPLLQ